MSNILDQIITNRKNEEVAKLDAMEIINSLFKELGDREKDVISRRFGLNGHESETLESIGQAHGLTRERIRQIETGGIKKLRLLKELDGLVAGMKRVISELLEEHGGLVEKEYLLNNLVNFSVGSFKPGSREEETHKSHFDFLVSKLLNEDFEEVSSDKFKNSLKLKHEAIDHLEDVAEELVREIKAMKKVFTTMEIIELAKGLEAYKKHEEKYANRPNSLDISNILRQVFGEDERESINAHKSIFSILQASRHVEQNKFGHWGMAHWREIKPKTINDKIFLVLKNHGQPLHFAEIADKINEISFDHRSANAATVHNELILDDKYVLVGRGLYGLKEWGYKEGTVADIVSGILSEEQKPLTRDEIIEKVLEQRLVKKATIILALMDEDRFEKVDGRYSLKK